MSFSPDELTYDPVEEQKKKRGKKLANAKKNEILKQRGMHKDLRSSTLKIFGEEYFNNYELSWLKFNNRVLAEALNEKNQLLERVKFISIVCSNLDEFFQKRVGGLKRQLDAGVKELTVDGATPKGQLIQIREEVIKMIETYRSCFFDDLCPKMAEKGIKIIKYDDLNEKQQKKMNSYFRKQLFPIITPLAVDEAHPFPFISNQSLSFAIDLKHPQTKERLFARLKIPSNRPRWIQVDRRGNKVTLIAIEDLIKSRICDFFPGMDVISAHVFRVTRNADVERNEEEADDLLETIEDALRERRFSKIVRLELDAETPRHIKQYLIEHLNIFKEDVFEMKGPIGLADAIQLRSLENFSRLKDRPWVPVQHPSLKHEMDEEAPSIFEVIKKGEFMVHHPYHSFEMSTQRFVEEAAADPKVLAIKQTLYRTSKDSPLMHALMEAAEEGKQVAVLVELKARFDEERNISWAQRLEKSGVHVAYGIPGLKIHSKLTMVVREEEDGLKTYCHIGTGNYHPDTAQLYEDLGFFTCNEQIGSDVTDIFNVLTGYAPAQEYEKLLVAPIHLRRQITDLIEYEIDQANGGKKGRIIAKMNSLEDPVIIQRLYEASQAGVQVDLIVRGVCRLIPLKEGLSENIQVHSIIGRFLEHSRVYYFLNGGEDHYYIGSADWMHRNLDARVEVLCPIDQPKLKAYLQFMLNLYLRDNQQRWSLDPDGAYNRVQKKKKQSKVSTHEVLMNHTKDSTNPIPWVHD